MNQDTPTGEEQLKIYGSSEFIELPLKGDLMLKVNSMWDFSARNVCFETIEKTIGNGTTIISYDIEECVEVIDSETRRARWKQADITPRIVRSLLNSGYSISKTYESR